MWSWLLARRLPRLLMSAYWVKLVASAACGHLDDATPAVLAGETSGNQVFFFQFSTSSPLAVFAKCDQIWTKKEKEKNDSFLHRALTKCSCVYAGDDGLVRLINHAGHCTALLFFFNVAKAVSYCELSIRIKSHRRHKSQATCTLTMSTTLDLLTSDCVLLWIKTSNESALLNNSRRTSEPSLSCGGAWAQLPRRRESWEKKRPRRKQVTIRSVCQNLRRCEIKKKKPSGCVFFRGRRRRRRRSAALLKLANGNS